MIPVGETVLYCSYIRMNGTPEVWPAIVCRVHPDKPHVLELVAFEPLMTPEDKWDDYKPGARLGSAQPYARIAAFSLVPEAGHWGFKGSWGR